MSQSPYLPQWATIKRIRQETELEKLFELELPDKAPLGHKPGQFVEVGIYGVGEAPISISSSPNRKESFDLVVRKVGNFTNLLHQHKVGDRVTIRGPYGNGFTLDAFRDRDVLFVAGGIGLVPLRSLIHAVLEDRLAFGRVIIMFGAKTPADLLFKDELAEWTNRRDIDFYITVDRRPAGAGTSESSPRFSRKWSSTRNEPWRRSAARRSCTSMCCWSCWPGASPSKIFTCRSNDG